MWFPAKFGVQNHSQIPNLIQHFKFLSMKIERSYALYSPSIGKCVYDCFLRADIQTITNGSPNHHVQGFLHYLPESVCKFTLDYDDNIIRLSKYPEA
jgi:hypothetical protein